MRKVPLVTNSIYHIFNRGVNKGDIFFSDEDYRRFLLTAIHYKTSESKFGYENHSYNDPGSLVEGRGQPKVEILAYCLMPNHFHFLIKQLVDRGVTSFMQHLINSYVHYVNIKYKRFGPLFQGRFKNILIESDEQLLHTSRYIHLNPSAVGLVGNLEKYSWSSYLKYAEDFEDWLCDSKQISEYFKSNKDLVEFTHDQENYARSLEKIKHIIIE